MPEYLAPGVYVEETSFRAKSIEGVGTTTTGFIGPTRYGPTDLEPEILTSLTEFERTFGDRRPLSFSPRSGGGAPAEIANYMWHAARAFFEEGGKRLYVSRVFEPVIPAGEEKAPSLAGHAKASLFVRTSPATADVWARFPGRIMDQARVTLTLKLGQNVFLRDRGGNNRLQGVLDRDVVLLTRAADAMILPGGHYLALWDAAHLTWKFAPAGGNLGTAAGELANLGADDKVQVITAGISLDAADPGLPPFVVSDLPLDRDHQRGGAPDSLFAYFAENPSNLAQARTVPLVLARPSIDGVGVLEELFAAGPLEDVSPVLSPPVAMRHALADPTSLPGRRSVVARLSGGDDGVRPGENMYEGVEGPDDKTAAVSAGGKTGLKQFEDLEDISIVAAPGATYGMTTQSDWESEAYAITGLMITHATFMRYRIAVLDCGDAQSPSAVRQFRARFDSTYAALYYPWVRILDPVTQKEINVPPSGFVAGIYCRNDINRAVYKAPANEVVNLALGFEMFLNKSQQDVLNPEGINCFRFFEGRGMRLWGARTISSDPEWKYVNLRRYFAYLERSIDLGTQWAVFEPNGNRLWDNVRHSISAFLQNEWQNGALLGEKPELAFFVKCDRSTMSQNDLDNGRLVCLVGVAPLRPAEFVIIRIGQWTADSKV